MKPGSRMDTPAQNGIFRLPLTDAQRSAVKAVTGRDGESIELTVEELEQRIMPRLASNHNETRLR